MSGVAASTPTAPDTGYPTVDGMTTTTRTRELMSVVLGTAVVDFTRMPAPDRRVEASCLRQAPRGLRVELHVGHLAPTDCPDCVTFLADAAAERSLVIDVHGDFNTVGAWIRDLRDAIDYRVTATTAAPRLTVVRETPCNPWETS